MKTHRRCAFACIALFALADSLACGGTDEAAQAAPADDALGGQVDGADGAAQPAKTLAYAPCSKASHVGGFRISLAEKFSGVQGQVLDGVVPMKVPEILMSEGTCQLMRAPNPFCSPGCEPGQACKGDGAGGSSGTCIGYPVSHPVGTVTVAGLKAELTMDAKWGNSYINPGTLPHPAFDPGDAITLRASGGDYEAFTLLGRGIAALTAGAGGSDITLEDGKSATLKWQASADTDAVGVHIELNINSHLCKEFLFNVPCASSLLLPWACRVCSKCMSCGPSLPCFHCGWRNTFATCGRVSNCFVVFSCESGSSWLGRGLGQFNGCWMACRDINKQLLFHVWMHGNNIHDSMLPFLVLMYS